MKIETKHTKNLTDVAKAVLREKFIMINAYFKKKRKSQINNLTLHLKELEKKKKLSPKVSRRKEIKMRMEINETETRKNFLKINENKNWVFLKSKIGKTLARLRKKKKTQNQKRKRHYN